MIQNTILIQTYSGLFKEIRKSAINNPDNNNSRENQYCFALDLSQNFVVNELAEEKGKLKKQEHFRQLCNSEHSKQKSEDNNQFLFNKVKGKTILQEINEKKRNISEGEIINYLKQLLKALYILHKQNILGRVFSTFNIINSKDGIVLMDFGFGPDIYQPELDIIASPEVVAQLILKQMGPIELKYDQKLDTWLLGAFLFHLVKQIPINSVNIDISGNFNKCKYNSEDLKLYNSFFKQQEKMKLQCRQVNSKRFSSQLCNFIQDLLIYDPAKRLSFLQIYQNQFIKDLNIENIDEIIKFYQQFEQNDQIKNLLLKVHSRERYLLSYVSQRGISNSSQNQIYSYINVNELFIYNFLDLENSSISLIWRYVNMEQFKYFLLNDTANDIILNLSKKNFKLKSIAVYILRKMSILILNQLISNLNKMDPPSQVLSADIWKYFQNLNQYQILQLELTQEINNQKQQLKKFYYQSCDQIVKIENIEQKIKESIQNDIEQNFSFSDKVQSFSSQGYKQTTSLMFDLMQKYGSKTQIYQVLKLKLILCHFINQIFSLEKINEQFDFIKPLKSEYLTPNDIYRFIYSQEQKKQKKEYIKQLIIKNSAKS